MPIDPVEIVRCLREMELPLQVESLYKKGPRGLLPEASLLCSPNTDNRLRGLDRGSDVFATEAVDAAGFHEDRHVDFARFVVEIDGKVRVVGLEVGLDAFPGGATGLDLRSDRFGSGGVFLRRAGGARGGEIPADLIKCRLQFGNELFLSPARGDDTLDVNSVLFEHISFSDSAVGFGVLLLTDHLRLDAGELGDAFEQERTDLRSNVPVIRLGIGVVEGRFARGKVLVELLEVGRECSDRDQAQHGLANFLHIVCCVFVYWIARSRRCHGFPRSAGLPLRVRWKYNAVSKNFK